MRHILQMVVHLISHIENNALGDPCIDIGFKNRDRLRNCKSHNRSDQQFDQQRPVFSDQGLINDPSCDDGRKQADNCSRKDRDEHGPEDNDQRGAGDHHAQQEGTVSDS